MTWKEQQVIDTVSKKSETSSSKRTTEKLVETSAEKKERETSILKRKAAKTPSKTPSGKTLPRGKVPSPSSGRKGNLSKGKIGKPERGSHGIRKQTESVSGGDPRKISKSAVKIVEVGDKERAAKKSSHGKGNQKKGKISYV